MRDMELNSRERLVLASVVELFLRSGRPVASRQVAAQPRQRLSPASIRYVISQLEDQGLVTRPHTSAGCVPSDEGLRTYLDHHLGTNRPPPTIRREVRDRFGTVQRELTEDMAWVAQLAADLTQEAGIVVRPVGEVAALVAMTVIDLGGRKVLGVTVTSDGCVYRRVASRPECVRFETLRRRVAQVSSQCRGKSMDSVRAAITKVPSFDVSTGRAEVDLVLELLPPEERSEVQVVGAENLFADEAFTEIDRLRSAVKVLGDRPGIADEWRRALRSAPTRVFIGQESRLTAGGNLGMVATLFYRGDRSVGAVGIVGPRGMNYRRVVPVVECIGESLSSFLTA